MKHQLQFYFLWLHMIFFSLPALSVRLTVLHIFNCCFYVHGYIFQLSSSNKQQDFYHHNWWAPGSQHCMLRKFGEYSEVVIKLILCAHFLLENISEKFVSKYKKKTLEDLFSFLNKIRISNPSNDKIVNNMQLNSTYYFWGAVINFRHSVIFQNIL